MVFFSTALRVDGLFDQRRPIRRKKRLVMEYSLKRKKSHVELSIVLRK